MDKLKSFASSAGSKATGMFTRSSGDNLHAVLQKQEKKSAGQRRREAKSDPFVDGPYLEEPTLPKSHMWIHLVTLFFTFLAVCTIGATAGFQAKHFGVSGGTGFTIFLLLSCFFLTTFLLSVPLIYDRWDSLKRPAQFLQQARSTLILHIFGGIMGIIACLIVTVSAFAAPGCKAAENDPHASLGDDYLSGLDQWCTTKKACAVFCWLAFGGWIALTALAVLTFRRERRHEPAFQPPSSPIAHNVGLGYSHVQTRGDDDAHDAYNEKAGTEISFNRRSDPERDVGLYNQPTGASVPRERYEPRMEPVQSTGHAFPLTGAAADAPSRTMQLAYSDPYAQVRASLMQSSQQAPPPQQLYGQGGLPAPPTYGGYR